MAYFIFSSNTGLGNLYKIAADDSDKDAIHYSPSAIVKTVSDEDFLKIKSQKAEANLEGDNVIIQDKGSDRFNFEQASELQKEIDLHIKICNEFIDNDSNQNNPLLGRVTSYRNMCKSFDVSTINFPLNNSWESYLLDNSIDFISPLQFCV
tara:strand:+ start:41 stop:493 length:453 start_codon:yes stop_codon:yes gene_type:complete